MFDEKIITEIENSKDYEIALLTTFNFDIDFFERKMLNTLLDNNVRKIELFVDYNELYYSLANNKNNSLNKKYIVNPIKISSAFHPKVILLLGDNKAKLIVSSANLTLSGYTLNNEIYNVFTYDKENKETLNLINDAISFFIKLNEIAYYKDTDIFEAINNFSYFNKKNQYNDIRLIHNMDKSVINQLKEIINGEINSMDIAVPYYDNELLGYKDISEKLNCKNVNLYIQNEKSTFPKEYNEQNNIISNEQIKPYYKLKSNDKKNFYHGKVYRFNLENKSFILYGSSNCTLSALSKTYHDGGNIECNILELGEYTDFNYFFENFDIDLSKELICNKIEYITRESTNFEFKYGIKKEKVCLYFQFKNKIYNLLINTNGNRLEYEYIDKDLVIYLTDNILLDLKNIFDIEISFNNDKESFICWYIDMESIKYIRNFNKEIKLNDIKVTDDLEEYRYYVEMICKALCLNKDESNERKRIVRMLNHNNDEEDDDIDDANDNFIIEQDLPDEYIKKVRDFSIASLKSKTFSIRFFKGLRLPRYDREQPKNENKEESLIRKPRPATPVEKRFERFIKNRIKDILNSEYIELIGYEHYKHNIGLMLDVINEFKYKENISDIFDDQYVVDSSIKMINELLRKDNSTEEDKESTILLALIVIVENHMINKSLQEKDYRIENENKRLLKLLDEKYKIREKYKLYLEDIIYSLNNHKHFINNVDVDIYLNELFEYKTKDELIGCIKKSYGENSIIELNDKVLEITSSSYDITRYFEYKHTMIIKDIINYSNHYKTQIEEILVTIENLKDNYNINADPVKKIIFKFYTNRNNYIQTIIRKSGKKEDEYKKY